MLRYFALALKHRSSEQVTVCASKLEFRILRTPTLPAPSTDVQNKVMESFGFRDMTSTMEQHMGNEFEATRRG